MTIREILWAVLLALAGFMSAGVTIYGIYCSHRRRFAPGYRAQRALLRVAASLLSHVPALPPAAPRSRSCCR